MNQARAATWANMHSAKREFVALFCPAHGKNRLPLQHIDQSTGVGAIQVMEIQDRGWKIRRQRRKDLAHRLNPAGRTGNCHDSRLRLLTESRPRHTRPSSEMIIRPLASMETDTAIALVIRGRRQCRNPK